MDLYLNLRAFLATAEHGNMSSAARWLDIAPSVVTKRVNQLETQLNVKLFQRTTRMLQLTENGRNYLDRARKICAEMDEMLMHTVRGPGDFEDIIRVKAPTLITTLHLSPIFSAYLREYRNVRLELVLLDRIFNPVTEGFDISIGAHPALFDGAADELIYPLRRMICASPSYIEAFGAPGHPRDLIHYSCLGSLPTGNKWLFKAEHGQISIDVRPRLICEDGQVLVNAAIDGQGLANVPEYAAMSAVKQGKLVRVLDNYTLAEPWLRAMVQERRLNSPAVRGLVSHLKAAFTPAAPWE